MRILEWVAISFSRGSSRSRDWTQVSGIAGRHLNLWATREDPTGTHSSGLKQWWHWFCPPICNLGLWGLTHLCSRWCKLGQLKGCKLNHLKVHSEGDKRMQVAIFHLENLMVSLLLQLFIKTTAESHTRAREEDVDSAPCWHGQIYTRAHGIENITVAISGNYSLL